WNGVAAGSYTLTAVATDNLLATQTSTPVHITVSGTLPAPWLDQDIGSVGLAGSATFTSAGSIFTVKGSGDDIETTADRFHFVYRPLSGDGQIVARVASVTNTDPWAKVGVMIRETLGTSSVNAFVFVSPSHGVNYQWRDASGGTTSHAGSLTAAPRWLKLVRAGNAFNGFESSDGSTWTPVFGSTVAMAANVYVGLAVTAHNNLLLNTSLFDGVAVTTGNSLPSVAITSPADGAIYSPSSNIPINATASDTDGTVTKVEFYNGTTLLGTDTTSPYSYAWNGVPAGCYTLTAVATDNLLATKTSNAVRVTVVSPTQTITVAPSIVRPGSTGNVASVPDAGTGVTYAWTIVGGTFTTPSNVRTVTFTAGAAGAVQLRATISNSGGCASSGGLKTVPVVVSDFNADAKTDILWRNVVNGLDSAWLLNGTTFAAIAGLPTVSDTTWSLVGTGDFNGDFKPDLVWRNSVSGLNGIWLMNGFSAVSVLGLPTVSDPSWKIVAVSDMNGDGKPDLVWRNRATGQNVVWLMDGTTATSVVALPDLADPNWDVAGAGDFDGDGKNDLVWRNGVTGADSVWLMNGTTFSSVVTLPSVVGGGWRIAAVGDFNTDGKPDLLWRDPTTGLNGIWLMDGVTATAVVSLPAVPDFNWSIAAPR
ncbi:MAG: FG-GAP-like repeat-containing protein, partial [Acidobacteriota bacterium]